MSERGRVERVERRTYDDAPEDWPDERGTKPDRRQAHAEPEKASVEESKAQAAEVATSSAGATPAGLVERLSAKWLDHREAMECGEAEWDRESDARFFLLAIADELRVMGEHQAAEILCDEVER